MDYDKLGELFIESLTPDNIPIMAFGMIPADQFNPFFNTILKCLSEKYAEIYELPANKLINCFNKKYISNIKLELGKSIYKAAIDIMVV